MFVLRSPRIPEYELEYETLPRAVRAVSRIPEKYAQLVNEDTGQTVRIKIRDNRIEVGHIVHPDSESYPGEIPEYEYGSVTRYNEKPLLRLVANQLRRFHRSTPIEIEDSVGIRQVI